MIPRSFNSSERSVDGVGLDVVIMEVFPNRNDSDTEEWGSLTPIPPPAPLPPPCALHPPPRWLCAALTVDALRVGDGPTADRVVVLLVAHQCVHPQDGCRTPRGSPHTPGPPQSPTGQTGGQAESRVQGCAAVGAGGWQGPDGHSVGVQGKGGHGRDVGMGRTEMGLGWAVCSAVVQQQPRERGRCATAAP